MAEVKCRRCGYSEISCLCVDGFDQPVPFPAQQTVAETYKPHMVKAPTKMTLFIPVELEAVRPDLQRFFDAMIYKLRRNAHKGNWEDVTLPVALRLLGQEVDELTEAVVDGNSAEVVFEAADVANFAMITANVALRAQEEK